MTTQGNPLIEPGWAVQTSGATSPHVFNRYVPLDDLLALEIAPSADMLTEMIESLVGEGIMSIQRRAGVMSGLNDNSESRDRLEVTADIGMAEAIVWPNRRDNEFVMGETSVLMDLQVLASEFSFHRCYQEFTFYCKERRFPIPIADSYEIKKSVRRLARTHIEHVFYFMLYLASKDISDYVQKGDMRREVASLNLVKRLCQKSARILNGSLAAREFSAIRPGAHDSVMEKLARRFMEEQGGDQ